VLGRGGILVGGRGGNGLEGWGVVSFGGGVGWDFWVRGDQSDYG
jgi:hypothetical protein